MHIDTQLIQGPCQYQAMAWPEGGGAEAVFIGRTRGETHPEFGALLRLDYEAHETMAAKQLRQMAETVGHAHGLLAVRVVHSIGPVALGEASVMIQVAAGHRPEAFAACRAIIEEIKAELVVWKKEVWAQGESFVAGAAVAVSDTTRNMSADAMPPDA